MRSFYVLILVACGAVWVFAEPATNSAAALKAKFVPEPPGRGTMGILSSCSLTLVLCIWTAVHCDYNPNERIRNKIIWMIISLFGPEVLASYAFRQWREARLLRRLWCEHAGAKVGSEGDLIGMQGAFFVVMGGCIAKSSDCPGRIFTLTPRGFIHFNNAGVVSPALSKQSAEDKGKAGIVAKLLVCFQALWMVVHSSVRKLNGLPVTLLEFHVVVQVVYLVIMYWFWWYKPLDVVETILVIEDLVEAEAIAGYKEEIQSDFLNKNSSFYTKRDGVCEQGWLMNWLKVGPLGWLVGWSMGMVNIFLEVFAYSLEERTDQFFNVLSFVFNGACHAIVWHNLFPTPTERCLWRLSVVILICTGPALLFLWYFYRGSYVISDYLNRTFPHGGNWKNMNHFITEQLIPKGQGKRKLVWSVLDLFIWLVMSCLYFLCAVSGWYLLVEAFISIRTVPDRAYETVPWARYWPHF